MTNDIRKLRNGVKQAETRMDKGIKRRKRRLPKFLERDEVNRILAIANLDAPTGVRNRAMLELMYRAGLRVGEVVALEPRDLNIQAGTIRVLDGKGGDGTAYFDPSIDVILTDWRRVRGHILDQAGIDKRRAPLFVTLRGGPVTTDYIGQMVKRYARRAGVDPAKVSPHKFRHTFAAELLREGVDLRRVQAALRHKNLETTAVYTEVYDREVADTIRARER